MRVQFIQSPTGEFKLAYDAGMYAELPEPLAAKLIDKGFAVEVPQEKRVNKSEATEKRAKVSGNNRPGKRAGNTKRGKGLAKG